MRFAGHRITGSSGPIAFHLGSASVLRVGVGVHVGGSAVPTAKVAYDLSRRLTWHYAPLLATSSAASPAVPGLRRGYDAANLAFMTASSELLAQAPSGVWR